MKTTDWEVASRLHSHTTYRLQVFGISASSDFQPRYSFLGDDIRTTSQIRRLDVKFALLFWLPLLTYAPGALGRVVASEGQSPVSLDWTTLGKLDYQRGDVPREINQIFGKTVRLKGFMVPVEDSQSSVTEFLLVPNALMCVHVPPPPPNYIVHVRMKPGVNIDVAHVAITVDGTLSVTKVKGGLFAASYEMQGDSVKRIHDPNSEWWNWRN